MLSRICEKTEEANIDTISSILADDSSIGGKRLKGGVSYGGPCYPRDNIALITYADKIGANSDIAQTTHRFNQQQSSYLTNLILSKYKKNNTVGILGLSYKPDTDVIDESAGLKLAIDLVKKNIPVILYDPKALENAKRVFRNKAIYSESLLEILDKSDILVITTPWKNFSVLDHIAWKKRKRKITLIDCWRMLNLKNTDIISYVPFGIGPQRVS
jgi:UDPglucose 6-dehydrogenase